MENEIMILSVHMLHLFFVTNCLISVDTKLLLCCLAIGRMIMNILEKASGVDYKLACSTKESDEA